MFQLDKLRATFRTAKYFIFVITLLNVHTCECRHIYSMKGQNITLSFLLPCDSPEVTLQQTGSLPFYRFTDGFLLSLPQYQANRFKIQISIENGNCSLDLTINNVKCIDDGTYLCTIYKDGQLLQDLETTIDLQVDHPPYKASCAKVRDKGGDLVAIECTANIGNLARKIECYQNGQKIPPVNDRVERYSSVTESFLIRKSQPAFCCSSTLNEYTERCECNDDALNLADGDSNNPCPPSSIVTTGPLISTVTGNNQADSTGMSSTPMKIEECKCNDCLIISSVIFPIAGLLILLISFVCYKKKTKTTSKTNHTVRFAKGVCEDEESVTIFLDDKQHQQSNKAQGRE